MPEGLATIMLVDPIVAPEVTLVELDALGPVVPMRMTEPLVPVALRIVCRVPAPRSVQLLGTDRVPLMVYVPAASNTTSPLGHDPSAAFNCARVTLGPAVVAVKQAAVTQIVDRLGIPPGTPAVVQSIAREAFRIPDQACA